MKTTYVGGYYSLKTKLVKTGLHRHTAALEDPVSDEMLEAVNIVQRTRWRINPFIADVMSQAFYNGDHIAGLPGAEDNPLPPPLSEETWEKMSPDERALHKMELARLHGENARRRGKYEALGRKLSLAIELKDEPVIWFPHALDFRGRVYPLPQDLHPQGDDTAKALLMFADGKPCTRQGFDWLKIALANAAGQDKLSFVERAMWVHKNREHIERSVADPLEYRWWAQTDERGEPVFDSPWVFLALAQEYVMVCKYGVDAYPCHVPVNIDATCSGIQHLSALGRDPVGGKATNLFDTGRREDLYFEVAEAVKRIVAEDAAAGVPEAQHWVGHITRSTVKRAVMTTPYGVTKAGIRDQLISDKHCDGLAGSKRSNAEYLTGVIIRALESTVVAAKRIMDYLQRCSAALAEEGYPLRWTTPLGMKVQQSYYRFGLTRVKTLYGETWLHDEDENQGLEIKDQTLAAAPNVIHSLDACHLAMTVRAAKAEGIDSFALVHDSYGTHACDVEKLGRILREQFVELYSGDWLAEFEAQLREYAPEVELPERPGQGTLEVSRVLSSPYFFS